MKKNLGPKLKKTLNKEICDDGTTFGEHIENIITHRRSIFGQGINITNGKNLQPKLIEEKIFTLEKNGGSYFLMSLNDSIGSISRSTHLPDGFYAFVVFIYEPYKIFCAELIHDEEMKGMRKNREGHTSFRGAEPVSFAGVIKFELGKMIFWNNASGHFKPAPEKRYNLLPHIRLLLPDYLFRNHQF